jgi:hypothetical protein
MFCWSITVPGSTVKKPASVMSIMASGSFFDPMTMFRPRYLWRSG